MALQVKELVRAGTRPFPPLSHTLWARCLGPSYAAEFTGWAAALAGDVQGCFVALFEGSGRVEGRLISLRRVTTLHVHYPAKSRIIDYLVSSPACLLPARQLIDLPRPLIE